MRVLVQTQRKRSWKEDRRILDKELLPAWRDRKASGVSRADLDAKWWTLPESATKNRVTHRVPFTDRVVGLLKEAKAEASKESPWAFFNHVDRGARATLVYQRYEFDAEKRQALEAGNRRFAQILEPSATQLLAFSRR